MKEARVARKVKRHSLVRSESAARGKASTSIARVGRCRRGTEPGLVALERGYLLDAVCD